MKVDRKKFKTELAKKGKSRADFVNVGIPSTTLHTSNPVWIRKMDKLVEQKEQH